MSLINDALKRAKTAQQASAPAADGPALHPADTTPPPNAGGSKMLFYILIGCVVIGNLFLFLYASKRDAKPDAPAVEARELPAITVVNPPVAPATSVAPVEPPPTTPVAATAPTEPAPAIPATTTEAPPVAQPEPPPPAPLKLQSVIMNPTRPSAMISGKFLFLGDRIQGYRVTAIKQESVTLVGNGQTNVLVLP